MLIVFFHIFLCRMGQVNYTYTMLKKQKQVPSIITLHFLWDGINVT